MSYEDKQFCSDFAELNFAKRGEIFCCYYAVTHYPKSLIFVQIFNFAKTYFFFTFSVQFLIKISVPQIYRPESLYRLFAPI